MIFLKVVWDLEPTNLPLFVTIGWPFSPKRNTGGHCAFSCAGESYTMLSDGCLGLSTRGLKSRSRRNSYGLSGECSAVMTIVFEFSEDELISSTGHML